MDNMAYVGSASVGVHTCSSFPKPRLHDLAFFICGGKNRFYNQNFVS